MKFLPYKKFTFTTKLSPQEFHELLIKKVDRHQPLLAWGNRTSDKKFEGKIYGLNFEISKKIKYRNSFLPVIYGKMEPFLGGAIVNVTLKPNTFVLVFMSIWLGVVFLVNIVFLAIMVSNIFTGKGFKFQTEGFIPLGMLAIGFAIFSIGFWPEAKPTIDLFKKVFDVDELS